jgi:hypothetical protein
MEKLIHPVTKVMCLFIDSIEQKTSIDNWFDLQYVCNLWTFCVVYEPMFDSNYLYFKCFSKEIIDCKGFDFQIVANKTFISSLIDIWIQETIHKSYLTQ